MTHSTDEAATAACLLTSWMHLLMADAFTVSQYGVLLILGAFVGGLGLPVFGVHTWAAWRYVQVSIPWDRPIHPAEVVVPSIWIRPFTDRLHISVDRDVCGYAAAGLAGFAAAFCNLTNHKSTSPTSSHCDVPTRR